MNRKVILTREEQELDKLNNQRRVWLWASSVVFWAIIFIIFFWDWIDHLGSKSVWWFIVSCMLILSINWWYWTMRIVRKLIHHQRVEYSLLRSIITDLGKIKRDVKNMSANSVDNPK